MAKLATIISVIEEVNMSKAKYDYLMDYIPNKDVYKAVMFACKMRREGVSVENAIRRASKYYDVDMSEVAHYMGQRGSRKRSEGSR
jgi:recombinational DNA repair protein RecR